LIDNPAWRRELELRARQMADRRFNWDAIAQQADAIVGQASACGRFQSAY